MRGRGVGGRAPPLRHQRRQVSHRGRDQEHRDLLLSRAGCCEEEFTVKLTPILSSASLLQNYC